jgi:hypothetical protein
MQLLFELVLKSDKNEDDRISDEDMDRFIIRVRAIYGKNHRVFDENSIREAFKASMTKTTHSLMDTTASMMEDEEKSLMVRFQIIIQELFHRFRPRTTRSKRRSVEFTLRVFGKNAESGNDALGTPSHDDIIPFLYCDII